jgi:hypothetical protein
LDFSSWEKIGLRCLQPWIQLLAKMTRLPFRRVATLSLAARGWGEELLSVPSSGRIAKGR